MAPEGGSQRQSLVDSAEAALRSWLGSGRHRPGDHLPPEHDLAAMLGVSRGTLRTALGRLEARGEVVRRQGSGTFVGRVTMPHTLVEGLERLESYASLARRLGLSLTHRDLRIEHRSIGAGLAGVFGLPADTVAPVVSRLLIVEGRPNAVMTDIVHPRVDLPSPEKLDAWLRAGNMILDVLIEHGLPVAFSSTSIRPVLLEPDDGSGRMLGVEGTTAGIELEETVRLTTGEAVQRSRDVFSPGGLELHVIRALDGRGPLPVGVAGAAARFDGALRRESRARPA
jgi:DNA-binding GntR family transcriptional regulator